MSGAAPPNEPFVNPYAGHRLLDAREKQVLGEYARLAATMKRVRPLFFCLLLFLIFSTSNLQIDALSTSLASSDRHANLLQDIRILERKMGLVLTLFKASVWSLVQSHEDDEGTSQDQL